MLNLKLNRLFILLLLLASVVSAQRYTQKDLDICNQKFKMVIDKGLINEPVGDVMIAIGKSFIGNMYEAHTLEKSQAESLVVNLSGFDCTTYVENCLVLARVSKMKNPSMEKYLEQLQYERYRHGKIDGYPSRLHYFTDWIYDAEKKGIVENITKKLGGIPYEKTIDFMTKHREAYKQLKDDSFYKEIGEIEKRLNKRKLYYLPQDSIYKIEGKLKNGDIIAFTTSIPGLDVSHVAFVIKMENGDTRILNAPDVGKKVQISEMSLSDYVKKNRSQTGIIVARPLEPK